MVMDSDLAEQLPRSVVSLSLRHIKCVGGQDRTKKGADELGADDGTRAKMTRGSLCPFARALWSDLVVADLQYSVHVLLSWSWGHIHVFFTDDAGLILAGDSILFTALRYIF